MVDLKKTGFRIFVFWQFFLFYNFFPAGAENDQSNWENQLLEAFSQALQNPEAFKATQLFLVLGYSNDQIKQISDVTPRPESITIEISSREGEFFENLRVICKKVRYYNLTIERAIFEFPSVNLDMNSLSKKALIFRSASEIKIETFVSAQDILKVFGFFSKARGLFDLKLTINSKETSLTGKIRKGFLVMIFKVIGIPEIEGKEIIRFFCKKLILNGLPIPRNVVKTIFDKINPVFNARTTWLNLELEKICLEKGFVHTWATIKKPEIRKNEGKTSN